MRLLFFPLYFLLFACSDTGIKAKDLPQNYNSELMKVKLKSYKFALPKREDIIIYRGRPVTSGSEFGFNFNRGPNKWQRLYTPGKKNIFPISVKVISIRTKDPYFQKRLPIIQESKDPYCARSLYSKGPICTFNKPQGPVTFSEWHFGSFRLSSRHKSIRDLKNGWTLLRDRTFPRDKESTQYKHQRMISYKTTNIDVKNIAHGAALIKCEQRGENTPFDCKANVRFDSGLYSNLSFKSPDAEAILSNYQQEYDRVTNYWDYLVATYGQ